MASSPITSWQIEKETMERVTGFIFLGSAITEDSDCNHEIKIHLLFGRKTMKNWDSMLKNRDVTLPTKAIIVQSMVFFSSSYAWMWDLDHKESWAPKKRCFYMWCWRRLLRVPWNTRRSNQSILKEINLNIHWKGLLLKLQYFGLLMWRVDSLEKTLMLRKIEGRRRGDGRGRDG